jgi:predicted enzyme related to lactoylglutathione lyase
MAFANNKFCWYGVISTDTAKTQAFFTEVCGWGVETMQMGDEEATIFSAGGVPFAHLRAPQMGEPSHINAYLRVTDVDAGAAAVTANGGQVIVPPTDIVPGRFSVVASASGAVFSLFHEADESTSGNHPGGDGSIHWTELHSSDVEADKAWLTSSFGFEVGTMPMPNGMTYYLLKVGDDMAGGAMPGMQPGAPSFWLSWVQVDDVDAAAARVTHHGGQLMGQAMDMPGVGRMVVAQDPTGLVFGLITPAARG